MARRIYKIENFGIKLDKINKIYFYHTFGIASWEITALVVTIVIGAFFRLHQLDLIGPYTDEYYHLLAVHDLMKTGTFDYLRAPLVTYSTALSIWLGQPESFLETLRFARVPNAIASTLTAIPIFLLARRISPLTGVLSAFLWVTSPWAIGVGRTVREYAYYPGLILLGALAAMTLTHNLINRYPMKPSTLLSVAFLIGLTSYGVYDSGTLVIGAFIVTVLLITTYVTSQNRVLEGLSRKKRQAFHASSAFLIVICLFIAFNHGQIAFTLDRDTIIWPSYFLNPLSPPSHWWGTASPFWFSPIIITSASLAYAIFKRGLALAYALTFMSIVVGFMIVFDRYATPRYIVYALPFFTITLAALLSAGILRVKAARTRTQQVLLAFLLAVILAFFVRPSSILSPMITATPGINKSTGEFHDDLSALIPFLSSIRYTDDAFIGTTPAAMLVQIIFNIPKDHVHHYDYKHPRRFEEVESFINSYGTGIMVLDSRRNGLWTPGYQKSGEFKIGDATVKLLEDKNDFQVYRWIKD